jgi:hypothetical protein
MHAHPQAELTAAQTAAQYQLQWTEKL